MRLELFLTFARETLCLMLAERSFTHSTSRRNRYTLNESLFLETGMSLEQQLIDRLQQLSPSHLEVVNESSGHGGYFPGKESHFKVIVVSEIFAGLRLVQRHQKIYAVAGDLLSPGKIHALAIHAFLPAGVARTRHF